MKNKEYRKHFIVWITLKSGVEWKFRLHGHMEMVEALFDSVDAHWSGQSADGEVKIQNTWFRKSEIAHYSFKESKFWGWV